jgi:signal transduction histidine kinase
MSFKAQSKLIILLVSLASIILILSNYYSTKVKSGIRSYINGESNYSKGQKDALLNLTYYLNTHDAFYWDRYNASLIVPESDNLARHSMLKNEPDSVAYNHFIHGKIHPADIGNIIWMFKNFSDVKEFKHAVGLWSKSEIILTNIKKSAVDLKSTIDKDTVDNVLKQELYIKISKSNFELTELEIDFSRTLSNLAREIERSLNWLNVFLTISIVGSLSAYLMWIIAKLYKSKNELKVSYDKVSDLNLELDTFVYSLSHDLRAPLTSLQGLVRIASLETDMVSIKENILLMDNLLEKQDLFIKDVISLLQRRNLSPQPQQINLKAIIEDSFALNNHLIHNQNVKSEIDIQDGLEEIYSDGVFIKIIVNNLISNAFKYSDLKKETQNISIRVSSLENQVVIQVEDNGIGISKEFHQKVFEMFYILNAKKRGTGLGLYIIKQAVEKLGGTIQLESTKGKGSKFSLYLPRLD